MTPISPIPSKRSSSVSLYAPQFCGKPGVGFKLQSPDAFSPRFGAAAKAQSPLVDAKAVMKEEEILGSLQPLPFQFGFDESMKWAAEHRQPSYTAQTFTLGLMKIVMSTAKEVEMLQEHRAKLDPQGKKLLSIFESFLPEEAKNRRLKGEEVYKLIFTHLLDGWEKELESEMNATKGNPPSALSTPPASQGFPGKAKTLILRGKDAQRMLNSPQGMAELLGSLDVDPSTGRGRPMATMSTPLAQLLTTFIQSEKSTLDRTLDKFISVLLSCEGKSGVPEEITKTAQKVRAMRTEIAKGVTNGTLAKVLEMDSEEGFKIKLSDLYDLEKPEHQRQMTESQFNGVSRMIEMLERTDRHDPSRTTLINQLHTILYDMPWVRTESKNSSKSEIRHVLDRDHYGLEEVKDKIVNHMGKEMHVNRLRKAGLMKKTDERPTIICLVGPPGVGKTSLGKSIAEATGRNFVRIALGGVSDEAEIRGHRSTYIGSKPGRIINGLIEAKSKNPLIMLDEIDKLGRDYKGDPAAALLEVLDPEQNRRFRDNFIGMDTDLSEAMFICTANDLSRIPPALRDRMQIIELPGYTIDQKVHIAEEHLIPRARKGNGLGKTHFNLPQEPFTLSREVIETIIKQQAPERGVRGLETCINTIAEHMGSTISDKPLGSIKAGDFPPVTPESLKTYLGPARFDVTLLDPTPVAGQVNGMFYSEGGRPGGTLPIQVRKKVIPNVKPNQAGLFLKSVTGNLQDVMKESVQRAFDWLDSQPPGQSKTVAETLGLDTTKNRYEIKVAAKEGAVPKDGPSAGGAIALALVSALTDRPVRGDFAMTGELDICGNIGKIGGVREKVSGSVEEGARLIAIPQANSPDIERIPAAVRNQATIQTVKTMDDVLNLGLMKPDSQSQPAVIAATGPSES